jgi:arginase family enzyme
MPILLGGDHSVTIPIFQGQRERYKDSRLGVLWVDAHPDLCDEFDGSKLSHACVLRRGIEFGIELEKGIGIWNLGIWNYWKCGNAEIGNGKILNFWDLEIGRIGINEISGFQKILG